MHALRALLPMGIVLALALTAFTGAAASAPATVPTWQVGQAVGYGTSVNLTSLFDTYVKPYVTANPSALNITTINALDFTGSVDSWTYSQVTQKTDTYYVLSSQSASGLKFHLDVNLTMKGLPAPGTYAGTPSGYGVCLPPTIPTTTRTLAVKADGALLATSQDTTYQQVSNLAYVNQSSSVATQANLAVNAYDVPMTSTNATTCAVTVSYESPSFTLTVDSHEQVRLLYQPALDYFNFPITDNKTWWANATATVGATLSGTINVQGLSAADQKAFFDNLTQAFQQAGLAVSGLSAFPIDLSQVSIGIGLTNIVKDGVVTDYPVPVNQELRAIASAQSLSDGSVHPVYLIAPASYACPSSGNLTALPFAPAAVYAPDFPAPNAGMIVGYDVLVCLGTVSAPAFQTTNTPPADAQQNISRTQTTYNPFPPAAATNSLGDFFVKSPYWGILLIVAVVVVAVVALVVLRRKRPPAAAPPPSPPPGTP